MDRNHGKAAIRAKTRNVPGGFYVGGSYQVNGLSTKLTCILLSKTRHRIAKHSISLNTFFWKTLLFD